MCSHSGGSFPSINPANNQLIANVANGTAEDIDIAISAARACLNGPNWGYKSSGAQRAVVLRNLGAGHFRKKSSCAFIFFTFVFNTV
jgi:acyl-CoA reductase-like NAD-dependent aldehyde dehydrogenase